VRLNIFGDYQYSREENANVSALETILTTKLIERLREDESGVYGTGARFSRSKLPSPRYSFLIAVGTSVDKYESLISSAIDEITKLQQHGPSQVDLDKFIMEEKRQLELQLKENRFWLGQLVGEGQNQNDLTYITTHLDQLEHITPDTVKEVANKYLNTDNVFRFIHLPETTEEK